MAVTCFLATGAPPPPTSPTDAALTIFSFTAHTSLNVYGVPGCSNYLEVPRLQIIKGKKARECSKGA